MTTRRPLYAAALLLLALAACPLPGLWAQDEDAPKEAASAETAPRRGLVGADPVAEADEAGSDAADLAKDSADVDGGDGRAFMGVSLQRIAGSTARTLGLPERVGLQVARVVPESSADKGGLEVGDVLHKFDDQLVITAEQFSVLVSLKSPGDSVKLTYYHKQKKRVIDLKLGERPKPAEQTNAGDRDGRPNVIRLGDRGLDAPGLTDEERRQLDAGQAVVRRIDGNGGGIVAQRIQLRVGATGADADGDEAHQVITDADGNVVGEVRVIRSVRVEEAPVAED